MGISVWCYGSCIRYIKLTMYIYIYISPERERAEHKKNITKHIDRARLTTRVTFDG